MEMTSGWRLILHGPASGAYNMAVDEAIGRAVAQDAVPPTLRFYAWVPACVSLGRNQALASIDGARCAALGYDIVRRPTGGRAILHTDELTYSVVARPEHPIMTGMVLDSYLRLGQGLVAGLEELGIPAEEAPGSNRAGRDVSAACFEVPSAYEIISGGRKLLGSAQTRRADYVLQHGSLPLTGDLTRLVDCLTFATEEEREALRFSLTERATTVEGITGRGVSPDEAAGALASGFHSALGIEFIEDGLSPAELAGAEQLMHEKYLNAAWTSFR